MAPFCTSCGTTVEEGTRFCYQCGAPAGAPHAEQAPILEPDATTLPAASAAPAAIPSRTNMWLIVAVFAVLAVVGTVTWMTTQNDGSAPQAKGVFDTARDDARRKSCFANQRTIEGSAQSYLAEHGSLPGDVQELVDAGFLKTSPTCPTAGGSDPYEFADGGNGEVSPCPVHGHY